MNYVLEYEHRVVCFDIPRLDVKSRDLIKKSIERKLLSSPEVFGKPLRKSLKGYRVLRVKNFRVVFKIEKNLVKIFAIKKRSEIYKKNTWSNFPKS
jgi:mRNA interferase RelE/StbE